MKIKALAITALLLSSSAVADGTKTINRTGKMCQICVENGSIKVCKFYKRCPVPEKKEND